MIKKCKGIKYSLIFVCAICLLACFSKSPRINKVSSSVDFFNDLDSVSYLQVTDSVKSNAVRIEVDERGVIYEVFENSIVKDKIVENTDRKSNFLYSNKSISEITKLDTRSSMKIMLFDRETQRLFLLDNTLSLQSETRLNQVFDYVDLFCSSNSTNNYWIYSSLQQKLMLIDEGNKILFETKNIGGIIGKDINPISIMEHESVLYMYDPAIGIIQFGQYANFLKIIPVKGMKMIKPMGNYIFCERDNSIYAYDQVNFMKYKFIANNNSIDDFIIHKDILFLLSNHYIYKYKM